MDTMITREDVVSYFRAFLGREPENDTVVELFMQCESLTKLAVLLGASQEFMLRSGLQLRPRSAPVAHVYEVVYGRPLDPDEASRLQSYGVTGDTVSAQVVRRIIGATDRQVRPTAFLVRFASDDIVYVPLGGFELAIDIADVAVGSIIVREKGYERYLTSFFRRVIKPGMTIVDVGANIGYYSMLAASLVGPAGTVISVEPNSENARLVLLSARRNRFETINLIPVALSTKTGSAFFSPHMGSNGGLLPTSEDVLLDPQCVVVPTIRMDDLVPGRVDVIKVDTEGAEGLILDGASTIIERHRPIISSEFSPEMLSRVSGVAPFDFLASFQQRGYRIVQLDREGGGDDETEIVDVDQFRRDYGDLHRISEIVFRP